MIAGRSFEAKRRLARAALLFEAVWPAIWPALGVLGAFVCAALLDLPQLLPPAWHAALLAAVAVAAAWLLARGLRRVRLPTRAEADRRLERDTGLRHSPLAVLADRPAQTESDAEPASLWDAHVARARGQIAGLRLAPPKPGLARRDPRALRAALLLGLAAALVVAGPDAPGRLLSAFRPRLPPAAAAPAAQLQVWATPPAYTGLAPVFFKPGEPDVSAPVGSHLTASVTGGAGEPSLSFAGAAQPFRRIDALSWQAERDVADDGRLEVRRGGESLGAWDVTAVPDAHPLAQWTEPPQRAGRSLQTRLPWAASDDYGVASLAAELRLRDRPEAPPLVVPIPLSGGSKTSAKGAYAVDLSANPWAGLPVVAKLVARDEPGQTGESAEAPLVLPERVFRHPAARVLAAARKMLALHPEDRRGAADEIDAVVSDDEMLGGDVTAALELGSISGMLMHRRDPAAVEQAQQELWTLALHFEEGSTARTARAAEKARQAAEAALQEAKKDPSPEKRAELDRKLEALQEAAREHLQALKRQAQRSPSDQAKPPKVEQQDMDRAADAAREAARDGDMAQAEDKLAELDKMLDALKSGQQEQRRQQAQKKQKARAQASAVQDMIGREAHLEDHAQSRASPQSRTGLNRIVPQEQDQSGRMADAKTQKALRRALGEMMQQYSDLTGKLPDGMGDADLAMRDAQKALEQGMDGIAGMAQQRAVEALQKGGKDMSRQLAQQFGRNWQKPKPGEEQGDGQGDEPGDQQADGSSDGQSDGQGDGDGQGEGMAADDGAPGDQQGDGQSDEDREVGRSARRDPLGRQVGQGSGGDDGDDVRVPEEMEQQRTRVILDELRRRGADRARPQPELDYIDRLLKQF